MAHGLNGLILLVVRMLISGLDAYVNALGRVATLGGAVVFVKVTKEIREGFDLATLGFLVTNFLRLAFGIVVLNAEDGSVLGVADFKFHLRRSDLANPCLVKVHERSAEEYESRIRPF